MVIERWRLLSIAAHNDTISLTAESALFARRPAGQKQEEHLKPEDVCQIAVRRSKSDPAVEQIDRVTDQGEKRHHIAYIRGSLQTCDDIVTESNARLVSTSSGD